MTGMKGKSSLPRMNRSSHGYGYSGKTFGRGFTRMNADQDEASSTTEAQRKACSCFGFKPQETLLLLSYPRSSDLIRVQMLSCCCHIRVHPWQTTFDFSVPSLYHSCPRNSTAQAENSRFVHLEMPATGGHVGFVQFNSDGSYWSENRAVEFLGQEW